MMSEEEKKAIEEINAIIEWCITQKYDFKDYGYEINGEEFRALKTTLKVINKLDFEQASIKTERDLLKEENKNVWNKNTELEYENEQLKDKVEGLKKEMTDFNDQWVHKDKLRKIKKEIEQEIKKVESDNRLTQEGKDDFITILLSKLEILEKIIMS